MIYFSIRMSVPKLFLDKILKRKGISKYRFAKILGMQQASSALRYFKTGYDPKLSMLERWAKALDVKIKDLFEE